MDHNGKCRFASFAPENAPGLYNLFFVMVSMKYLALRGET